MPYEFEAPERIQVILFVIEKINDMMHSCDTAHAGIFEDQLKTVFDELHVALEDLRPVPKEQQIARILDSVPQS